EGTDEIVAYGDWTLGANIEVLTLAAGAVGVGNALANTITGNANANLLQGLGGNDVLDGGTGGDEMIGGLGDDRYIVDSLGDTTIEQAGEGTDEVVVYGDWTLGANIELLTLAAGVFGVGNALANVITGNSNANVLAGLDGDDRLIGLGGNDVLDGGTGGDEMIGGLGDDRYVIDSLGDIATELAGEGTDEIVVYGDWTLGTNFELLTLAAGIYGTGNAVDNVITGNSNANALSGLGGADRLIGLAGNDILDGGSGADEMIGGTGGDRYIVDNASDQTIETDTDSAFDEVWSSVDWTLGVNVEHLTLTGAAIRGTGNGSANGIVGNALANLLEGLDGNDQLVGLNGNDVLDGGTGGDAMYGGAGDDRYIVDSLGDTTVEFAGEGTDEIVAYGDWTLGANIEVLTLAAGAVGVGNALANTITGNAQANYLDGKDGGDRLTGGAGADAFVFSTALGAGNVDEIADFNVADDAIYLSVSVFTAIGAAALDADAFHIGSAAADAEDRIVYDSATGALYYDADGSGAGAAVQFATLSTGLALTHDDFFGFGP
ncbi:MAG: calcium-binding protein, partial [Hyphomonadaceae bacterium]